MPRPSARITGGELAGRTVRVPGRAPEGFRPSSGRLREALFNILSDRISGSRFLDLFAGSGLMGYEALSRGAAAATFVEAAKSLVDAIRTNAQTLGVADRIAVHQGRLPGALASLEGPFDIIYLDPPYALPDPEETLNRLDDLLAPGGQVVYEHSSRYNPPQRPHGLELEQRRIYGDSALALYCSSESE